MQIIVPAAGNGSRFAEKGYTDPKPIINVLGKPLIKWSTDGLINSGDNKYFFLLQKDHIERFQLEAELSKWYNNFEIIPVDGLTRGQASTCLLAKEMIDQDDELAIINCDNLFMIDLELAKSKLDISKDSRGIVFFIAGNNPGWSYVATDQDGLASEVAEKVVISNKATVGCYYFIKGKYFINAAESMIEQNIRYNNEFYVSPCYNIFIKNKKNVHTWPCDFHYSLGTPELVDKFVNLFNH